MPPESSAGGGPWITGRRTALVLGSLFSGLALLFLIFFGHQGLYKIYRLKQERARLEQENARLAEENTRLARTIDRLHHDPEMIQDLIRRELNFVKKNEIIVQLPPEQEKEPAAGALLLPHPSPPAEKRPGASAITHSKAKPTDASRKAR